MTGTALIQRATIDEIVGNRNLAIEKFSIAMAAMDEAFAVASKAAGGLGFYVDREKSQQAFSSYDRGHVDFLEYLRKQTDRTIWSHLVNGYGFDKLMDRQAHEEFRAQLDKDPPEVSVETAEATIATLVGDAEKIFRRGIANAFSKLDRRFRSHDGFKIGERVVLSSAFDDFGMWNHHSRHDDTIRDIERTFMRLDGKEMPEHRYAGIIGVIDDEKKRHTSLSRSAWEVDNEYFRVKAFKNGNCHIWFKRDDLLERINKLLAEHYGAVLGAGSDAVEDDPLSRPNTSLAKNMGWFPTPEAVVSRIMDRAELSYARSFKGEYPRVLEPSAGEGAIILGAINRCPEAEVVCVELHGDRAATLASIPGISRVVQDDFLRCSVTDLGTFDRILMNPPFDMRRDIDHVAHAVRFLRPGGRIVAVMSAGVEFAMDKKSVAFRKLIEKLHGGIYDLPSGSFEESGTMVNTCLVTLTAPRA